TLFHVRSVSGKHASASVHGCPRGGYSTSGRLQASRSIGRKFRRRQARAPHTPPLVESYPESAQLGLRASHLCEQWRMVRAVERQVISEPGIYEPAVGGSVQGAAGKACKLDRGSGHGQIEPNDEAGDSAGYVLPRRKQVGRARDRRQDIADASRG